MNHLTEDSRCNQKVNMKKLSILIPSIPQRRKTFLARILDYLELQIKDRDDIEILCLYDNQSLILGDKRNSLLTTATGQYVTFVDDDDWVVPNYVEKIVEAINSNPDVDVIVYDTICTDIIAGTRVHCKYGIEFDYNHNYSGRGFWTGPPAHTMVFRRELVKDIKFPPKKCGEDSDWARQAALVTKTQYRINDILYYYDFNMETSATRS